jgi:hypothetical protein
MNGTNIDCRPCPVGTACVGGATLLELPIEPAYFRLSNTTLDVQKCTDFAANCSGTAGTFRCQSSSGCRGSSCAPGLTGIFCQLCDKPGDGTLVHYVKASDDTIAHCKACGSSTGITIGIGILLIIALLVAVAGMSWGMRKLHADPDRSARVKYYWQTFTPNVKLKLVLGFYLTATKIDEVYDVSMPRDVKDICASISSVVTFGLTGVATTPLECMGLGGYVPKLVFWMLVPLIVIVVIVAVIALVRMVKRHAGGNPPAETLLEQTLPPALMILFLAYPKVTQIAFEAFPCHKFESDSLGWLKADVSIKCGSPAHSSATGVAWLAISLYPVGLISINAMLLFKARQAIVDGIETPLTRAIGFLHKEYDPICFWWEIPEMVRRFLLVGLFVVIEPGKMIQLALGTIVSAVYLLVQLQAHPYKDPANDALASASSFSLLMVFICSIFYKYAALTDNEDLRAKMSLEQQEDYIMPSVPLSVILILSVAGSIVAAGLISVSQVMSEARKQSKLRRLKFVQSGNPVVLESLVDEQAYHLFLSHSWPAAQDRMRIVKARFLEALPSCRTFLDVDDLKSGSGTAEVDQSNCILVFCTAQYFTKQNSLKELYRAVVQRRPILAMLEPDATQEGGLNQAAVEALITNTALDKFKLRKKWVEWKEQGSLLPNAFAHAPDEADVRAALFAIPPVEWNRLPHFQDVTIRKIAQDGILGGNGGELYLQGEAAMGKVSLPPPLNGREFHLFCSAHNAGAVERAIELKEADVWVTQGKKESASLTYTTDVTKLALCDHMLVLLDERTWTSGEDTAKFVDDIHAAMRAGVHLNCIHEFPSVVGPPRHECEFGLMFSDDWTPAHLLHGPKNIYKEIAFALKGTEWRKPGLVAIASKLAMSAGEHRPIEFNVPDTYEPATGPNPWLSARHEKSQPEPAPTQPMGKEPAQAEVLGVANLAKQPEPVNQISDRIKSWVTDRISPAPAPAVDYDLNA